MGRILDDDDEVLHPVGDATNWNESRYVDFWDPVARIGGWLRMGQRPNEGRGEVSVCVHLPDGTTACSFRRPSLSANGLSVGGQAWDIKEPWRSTVVRFDGKLHVLADPWRLLGGHAAFDDCPIVDASIELACETTGLAGTLGYDQDHVGLIFVPGQAEGHYQHLARTTGTIRLGDRVYPVDGRGAKDHSWGPRNWHAKVAFRWLNASFDGANGFMLTQSISPTVSRLGGFCLVDGEFQLIEYFETADDFSGTPHPGLDQVDVTLRSASGTWTARGKPQAWVPLRHRQKSPDGKERTLRIVKSPAEWVDGAGRVGVGSVEYHDLLPE